MLYHNLLLLSIIMLYSIQLLKQLVVIIEMFFISIQEDPLSNSKNYVSLLIMSLLNFNPELRTEITTYTFYLN